MSYLLDTNILSELRKGARCSRPVRIWFDAVPTEQLFTSVLVFGEIRNGIERLRIRDASSAQALERWSLRLETMYAHRILPVTLEICDVWGRLSIHQPLPFLDGLLAATAIHHRLTLVTRNARDVERSGVNCLNPFIA